MARSGALRVSLTLPLVGIALTLPLGDPENGGDQTPEPPAASSPPSPPPPPAQQPQTIGQRTGGSSSSRSAQAESSPTESAGQSAASPPGPEGPGQEGSFSFAPGRVLVGARVGQREETESEIRARSGRVLSFHSPGNFYLVETPSRAPDWARSVRANPGVRFAEVDYLLTSSATPNDPRLPDLWGLRKIGMPATWDTTTGSAGLVVGVIDSGVDYSHPDIGATQMWTNPNETRDGLDNDGNGFVDDIHGADCANNDGDPMDDNNHGTHVAGTIGAATNNATGVAGTNWNVKIMALKFLDSGGSGYLSNAVRCIDYAISKGARLTNNSWGGGGFSQALYDAISRTKSANQLFVAAAGNANTNTDTSPNYPASYDLDNVISVAAADSNDVRASFSNYGKVSVDVAAPGVGILSTVRGGYSNYNGTSMAAPHVAGTAALMLAKNGSTTPYSKLRDAMFANVDAIPGLVDQVATGGRLNAAKAIGVNLAPLTLSTLSPEGAIIETGGLRSGSAADLRSDDGAFYRVNSTTSGTRTTSWYGRFSTVPSALESLRVTYKGSNSASCSQTVSFWRFTTQSWVQVKSQSVGTTQVEIRDLAPSGSLSDYVNSIAGGEVRVRIRCSRSSGNFYSNGNLMRLVYKPR